MFLICVLRLAPVWWSSSFSAFWLSFAHIKGYFNKMLIPSRWFVYHTFITSHSIPEPVWLLGAQYWESTRSLLEDPGPKLCCKMDVPISNYLHKPWRHLFLESRPPVRGKIKSYVCRKYYTRLPQGKIFISLPMSSLYFSYLSGVLASELSFCIPKMYHIKTRTWPPCCEKISDNN